MRARETREMSDNTEDETKRRGSKSALSNLVMCDDALHDDVEKLLAELERDKQRRAEIMPDEKAALKVMFEAYTRLKELGFNDAIYCPKNGTVFDAIEPGFTSIGKCSYDGKWPNGHWWMHEADDLWPSRPILFRKIDYT